MKTNHIDPQRRRKGVFLLVMPVFVLPILFGLSWVLFPVQAASVEKEQGLNTVLPVAQVKQEKQTKAAAYEFLDRQSKQAEQPDLDLPTLAQSVVTDAVSPTPELGIPDKFLRQEEEVLVEPDTGLALQEELIQERLKKLDELTVEASVSGGLNKSPLAGKVAMVENQGIELPRGEKTESPELVEMQQLMAELETSSKQPDAQLEQLSEIMDKLLVLQNPELAGARVEEDPIISSPRAFPALKQASDTGLNDRSSTSQNGFFGLSEFQAGVETEEVQTTFLAVVPRTQELLPGDALEIKLEESLWINGKEIPAGTAVFGKTSLSSNRLQVRISAVLLDNQLLPLDLIAYSTDAMPGLAVNGKSGAGKAMEDSKGELQSLGMLGMGMDWQAQVANSGIEVTKGLLKSSGKAKQITVKAGHPLLLVNASQSL